MISPLYFIHYRTRVPSRARSLRIEARGIFLGAEVVRGHDWRWGNQDGKWLCWSLFPFTLHALKVPLVQHLFQCSRIYIQRLIYDVLSLVLVISFMQGGVDLGGTWGQAPTFNLSQRKSWWFATHLATQLTHFHSVQTFWRHKALKTEAP